MSINAFIAYLSLEKNYSPHTVSAYKKDIHEFKDFTSKEYDFNTVDQVDYSIIRSWIVVLVDGGIANRTVNRKIASLKAYYKFLQKAELIAKNPLAKHKALKTKKKLEVPFSEMEMDKILKQIPFENDFEGARDKLIIAVSYTHLTLPTILLV